VDELIRQIRAAVENGLFYLALIGTLALIDMCAALDSDNGETTGSKYRLWLEHNVPEHEAQADAIYKLRCSLLHQGSAYPHGSLPRVAFTMPGFPQWHKFDVGLAEGLEQVNVLSTEEFVAEVTSAAERWMAANSGSDNFIRNYQRFAQYRPDGLPPFMLGVPLIA
jgi:hypothetical protein